MAEDIKIDPLTLRYNEQNVSVSDVNITPITVNAFGNSEKKSGTRAVRFDEETIYLVCEWEDCSYETQFLDEFMDHVSLHHPAIQASADNPERKIKELKYFCRWLDCPFTSHFSEGFYRHMYLHGYHSKLKCIGQNTTERSGLNPCMADSGTRNVLPNLAENLLCAWDTCSEIFINIQKYYDHIRYHCEDQRSQKGGYIQCKWTGCKSRVCNVTKLKDHMRSHTQEKVLACPTCGALFSSRTRYIDHCNRQSGVDNQSLFCGVCTKSFSTARLLREHVRSHINMYKCQKCDMTCSSLSALSQHQTYRHSNERPHKCPYCDFRAKLPSDLVKHARSHEYVLYCCPEVGCSYQSKTKTCIQNHINKIHASSTKNSKYACHLCDKRYYLKGSYLTDHLKKVHQIEWPSGHSRFRYTVGNDGFYRLNAVRYELGYVVEPAPEEFQQQQSSSGQIEEIEPMENKIKLDI